MPHSRESEIIKHKPHFMSQPGTFSSPLISRLWLSEAEVLTVCLSLKSFENWGSDSLPGLQKGLCTLQAHSNEAKTVGQQEA